MGNSINKSVSFRFVAEMAKEYVRKQDRDKRLIASRYVLKYRENAKQVEDMGFIQFLWGEMNKA